MLYDGDTGLIYRTCPGSRGFSPHGTRPTVADLATFMATKREWTCDFPILTSEEAPKGSKRARREPAVKAEVPAEEPIVVKKKSVCSHSQGTAWPSTPRWST